MTKENLITSDKSTNLEQAKEILLKKTNRKTSDCRFRKSFGRINYHKDIDNQLEYPKANKDQNGRLIVGRELV